MTPIYKKGQKEHPGHSRPVSLTSVPGKVMERLILSVLTRHVQACAGMCRPHLQAHQAQPAWIHERQVLHDQPDLLQ